MSKKDNIVGIMKQNYTKHVYFLFFNKYTILQLSIDQELTGFWAKQLQSFITYF